MYPKPLRLIITCWMVAGMWGLLSLFFLGLLAGLAGLVGPAEVWGRVVQGTLLALIVLVPVQIGTTLGLRCPACNGYVTLETFGPFHPAARITTMGGRYAAVVLDVLREHRFTCMYCGRRYEVDERYTGSSPR